MLVLCVGCLFSTAKRSEPTVFTAKRSEPISFFIASRGIKKPTLDFQCGLVIRTGVRLTVFL